MCQKLKGLQVFDQAHVESYAIESNALSRSGGASGEKKGVGFPADGRYVIENKPMKSVHFRPFHDVNENACSYRKWLQDLDGSPRHAPHRLGSADVEGLSDEDSASIATEFGADTP
jgi:hypothetical protein